MTREEEKRKGFESNGREETEGRKREMCVVLKVQRNRENTKRYSRKKKKKEIILDSSVGRARGC